jgi:hypothetical protein
MGDAVTVRSVDAEAAGGRSDGSSVTRKDLYHVRSARNYQAQMASHEGVTSHKRVRTLVPGVRPRVFSSSTRLPGFDEVAAQLPPFQGPGVLDQSPERLVDLGLSRRKASVCGPGSGGADLRFAKRLEREERWFRRPAWVSFPRVVVRVLAARPAHGVICRTRGRANGICAAPAVDEEGTPKIRRPVLLIRHVGYPRRVIKDPAFDVVRCIFGQRRPQFAEKGNSFVGEDGDGQVAAEVTA